MEFALKTPVEISGELGRKVKHLRLEKKWTRTTLSRRSGVPVPTLRRFEDTGKIALESFLKLVNALGRLDELESILKPAVVQSLSDLERQVKPVPKRGTI